MGKKCEILPFCAVLSAFLKIACIVCSQRLESYSRLPKSNSDKKLLNGFFTIKGFFFGSNIYMGLGTFNDYTWTRRGGRWSKKFLFLSTLGAIFILRKGVLRLF